MLKIILHMANNKNWCFTTLPKTETSSQTDPQEGQKTLENYIGNLISA